ncbi:hypothetical protein [Legionella geestiana]|uniref:hypothetical protein n=1 Tax=Legionella geestiana TaxID=45065 RepID=UPI0010419BC8|nr:hypothetical protein [Legionella geestiana]
MIFCPVQRYFYQFEDALKLLFVLFEVELFLRDGQKKYERCMHVFLSKLQEIINSHCSKNSSLSDIHNLLMILSQSKQSEIRLLATQAILIAVYESYCIRYCDEARNYPLADLQELFLPQLLQLMNDPDMEVRKFAACCLCFLDFGSQVDPQLLMYYAADLLNSDNPAWQTRSILALSRPAYDYPCFLSQEVVSRLVHLCVRSDLLSASVHRYRFRIETFNLLNFQVQYTGIPLPLETIEQCLEYDREGRISPSGRTLVAGSLLRLIGKNFEDQEALKTIPHTISEAVLSCFDNAELRKLAFNNYCLLIQAAGDRLKETLFDKLFCKMRSVARQHNPETHDFVQAILNRVSWSRKEKNEILSMLGTAESPEVLQAETSSPDTSTDEKDLPTLLAELNALNGNNPNVMTLLTSHDLETTLAAVKAVYSEDSQYLPAGRPIADWEVGHCQAWAQAVIQDKPRARSKDFQNEMVAVVMRAGVLDSGQTPRNIQLISLLLLLKAEDRGCLAEVKTGEGKTKIVSMFAAIKVLQYDFVDVVSSSTVLAKRDAHELQNFYSILKMTVADNIDGHSHDGKAPRSCYLANVVYGDTNEYQWDLVRQAIGDSITRGDRPFRILFFDEVDSLLVDRSEHAAMILKPHPGLEYVNHLMVALWHMMVRVGQSISKKDGEWVYQSADGNNQFKIDNPLRFARSLLKKYIVTLIEDPSSSILLPSHLKHFVLTEADDLTDAAVDAYYVYHPDKHYVISEGDLDGVPRLTINPIDARLTGEINKNSRWTYLSSFLELRHGLKMGAPQLMSNYMSTPGLCKRYGNQIYGLTGTLGAEDTQALLKDMYQVDLAFIPTYKPRCLIEYEGLLAPGKTDWLANILGRVQEEVNRERPVLVVAATIADVIFLEKEIRKAGFCQKISRFSRNDTDEINMPDQAIEAGEVIVATLIAARGIDWYFAKHQEKAIDMRGGMHVIVTTLPLNLRVEQQIFGRTARKGNRGSAELIINRQAIQHQFNEADRGLLDTIQTVKIWRDKVEAGRVHAIRTRSIRLALLKDDLYTRFRGFINTLKNDPMALHRIGGIEEQWAYWLRNVAKKFEHDFNPDTTLPLMEADFEQFIETVRHDPDVIRKNPCRQVQHGNLLNFGTKGIGPDFAAAINAYTRAIQDDPIVGVQAYYNRAEARIFLKEPNYKENVLSDLHMAKTNLENHIIPQLHSMLVVHNLNPVTTNGFNNDFARQIHCKIELLKLEIANIDQNISIIQQARYQARKAKQKVDFEICELKNLQDFFPDPEARPQKEISELHSSGLSHLFSIQPFFRERKGSGFGALCVAFLGILQIVVGVLVSYAAPMMGSLLIQEGINDIMYAAKALIAGNFDWNAYLANKIGSVSISVISMGLDVLKNSANLEVAAEAAKGQNALKNLTARQLNHEQILEMAKKEVVKRVIDTGVREVFNFAVDKLTTVAMDQFSGDIEDAVGKRLERNLGTTECQSALHAMLQLDVNNRNAAMQGQLDRMASKVMQDRTTLPNTIANHIIKGVLANQHKHVGTFLRIADMGMAFDKILQLADNFTRKFRAELLFFHHQHMATMPQATSVDYQATAPLKNQFFARVTQRLTQCIIAIAKGQIIHPGIDMAMHEHLQNIANLVQQHALQPPSPECFAAATEHQPEARKKTKSTSAPCSSMPAASSPVSSTSTAAPSGFGKHLMDKRNDARDAALKQAFLMTLTKEPAPAIKPAVKIQQRAAVAPQKPTSAPKSSTPGQALVKRNPPGEKSIAPARKTTTQSIMDSSQSLAKLEYPQAITRGVKSAVSDFVDTIAHPVDKIVCPAAKLIHDTAVLIAVHAPGHEDFGMLHQVVKQNPGLYQDALGRMQQRGETFRQSGITFMGASGPKRAEMLAEMGTGILLPGYFLKGVKYTAAVARHGIANKIEFGTFSQPPHFNNVRIHEPSTSIPKFETLTRTQIQNQAGTHNYIWIIDTARQLLIAPRQVESVAQRVGLIVPDQFKVTYLHHHQLASFKPVLAAGELTIEGGAIKALTDLSGHYLPAGSHLPYLVERNFQRFGLQDAKGKYQPYVPLPGLGKVEQPIITFAPNPVSFGFAPGVGDMTAGSTVFGVNFLEGSHHQQDIERVLPPSLAMSPDQKAGSDLPTKKVKLFDITKTDTSRHRFFSRDNANPGRDRQFPGSRTAKETFLSHAAASIKQHPPEPALPEQPPCSASGYTIAALQGGYDAMDQVGLIPHDPYSTSAVKKQAIKSGHKFFNVKDDREEHAGAQKVGFWLFGAVHGLYEHYKACNP